MKDSKPKGKDHERYKNRRGTYRSEMREVMERAKGNLEKALIEMARRGLLELPVTDELVAAFENQEEPEDLSQEEFGKLYNTVCQTWQDLAIEKAKQELPRQVLPFGTLVHLIRENAGLTLTEMASRIKKGATFLENLEANIVNPLDIQMKTLCDVMEAFHLTISEFLRSAQDSLILLLQKKGGIQVMARSPLKPGTEQRRKSVARAADALLIEKAKKEGKTQPMVEKHFLDHIRRELGIRGREDLLV